MRNWGNRPPLLWITVVPLRTATEILGAGGRSHLHFRPLLASINTHFDCARPESGIG